MYILHTRRRKDEKTLMNSVACSVALWHAVQWSNFISQRQIFWLFLWKNGFMCMSLCSFLLVRHNHKYTWINTSKNHTIENVTFTAIVAAVISKSFSPKTQIKTTNNNESIKLFTANTKWQYRSYTILVNLSEIVPSTI